MCFVGSVVVSVCSLSAFVIALHQILGIPVGHSELLFAFFRCLHVLSKEVSDLNDLRFSETGNIFSCRQALVDEHDSFPRSEGKMFFHVIFI